MRQTTKIRKIHQSLRQQDEAGVVVPRFKEQQVPGAGASSGSSGTGTDTFFSGVTFLGASGTSKTLIVFIIKNSEDEQDSSKDWQSTQCRELGCPF